MRSKKRINDSYDLYHESSESYESEKHLCLIIGLLQGKKNIDKVTTHKIDISQTNIRLTNVCCEIENLNFEQVKSNGDRYAGVGRGKVC